MIAFPEISMLHLALAFMVTLFAGFTKGVTGFALPMIMVSGMAMFLEPKLAIAAIVLPTFVSNVWQALQNGWRPALDALKKFRVLIGVTLVMIFVNAQWIAGLELDLLLIILGSSIAMISLVQLVGLHLQISEQYQTLGAVITGMIAGFFGAISGTWGPPTVVYLLAINTPKAEQVRTQGISFGLGALVFWIAHQSTGLVTSEALGLSLFLLLPMAIGLSFGRMANERIDQALFRKAVLWVLLLAALNILRRALFA